METIFVTIHAEGKAPTAGHVEAELREQLDAICQLRRILGVCERKDQCNEPCRLRELSKARGIPSR